MRRREFIALVGGAAAWPARAQQTGKLPTIGFLGATAPSAEGQRLAACVQRLRELGWVEGRNVAMEVRWADGHTERFAGIIAELVQLKVDVILTHTTPAALAVKQATSVIPIVFASQAIRSAPASSRAWRDQAATSPACRVSRPILQARSLNSCARLSPAFAGWQSWAMSAVPMLCWR